MYFLLNSWTWGFFQCHVSFQGCRCRVKQFSMQFQLLVQSSPDLVGRSFLLVHLLRVSDKTSMIWCLHLLRMSTHLFCCFHLLESWFFVPKYISFSFTASIRFRADLARFVQNRSEVWSELWRFVFRWGSPANLKSSEQWWKPLWHFLLYSMVIRGILTTVYSNPYITG